ncbi:flavodoxin family protein [Thalassotalea atypica]|uniref:flavodoxin family protein n=1 Tax=Thalassotalea atypica TaxID=2054316 RepID=UPI002573A54C|nr:NAD(P)H-dependent oxidoreductase [Thalassotalea atypica]
MRSVIVLGTSRKQGNTEKLVNSVAKLIDADVIDLTEHHILPFDYNFNNQHDDFVTLTKKLLQFDHIILASPIYWYAPSAQMKVFLDRLSDLLKVNRDSGRLLRTKVASVLSTGASRMPELCFEQMFKHTFDYLGMEYLGMQYCYCADKFELKKHQKKLNDFARSYYALVDKRSRETCI